LHILPRGNRENRRVPRIQSEGVLPFINLRSGIDVYAHWAGKTLAEERAQITGHSVAHGHVGYLRESYDGEPYALEFLVPEAFEGDAEIPATLLRARLAEVLRIAAKRQATVYHRMIDDEAAKEALKSFADFVDLCERKEGETGKPCRISARY
jgi:hypothetical protein